MGERVKYKDALYGEWELPDFLKRLAMTKEMVRLRNITQSVLPNDFMPRGPIPSRFQHGLGVARLADAVLENYPDPFDYKIFLLIAALLHDAGNPPFSHLCEPFLKEATGYDGESFLKVLLDGSEAEKILKEYKISVGEITAYVTGNARPFSDILNGSMDIDNLDNVGRYNLSANLGAEKFNAIKIASSFRLNHSGCFDNKSGWFILDKDSVWEEAQKWKKARRIVYSSIYGTPHLSVAMMVYRAVEIAFFENEIGFDFFLFNDHEAIAYLLTKCNSRTRRLVEKARRWDWYEEIIAIETANPTLKLKELASNWKSRKYIADKLCERFSRGEPDAFCVYIGKGKDKRKIIVPFVYDTGDKRFDLCDDSPIYRFKVWMDRKETVNRKELKYYTQELIS